MSALKNQKYERFCQYYVALRSYGEAYIKAGFRNTQYNQQNAYKLKKAHPEIQDRIDELEEELTSRARHERDDYLDLLDDITFAKGEFSGDNTPKLEKRLSACTKAMKAQGIEGDTNINVSNGAFQLIVHSAPEGEEEDEDGGK